MNKNAINEEAKILKLMSLHAITTAKLQSDINLREGQAYMNALFELDRRAYEDITATEFDPFYDDNKLTAFFERLKTLGIG